VRDDAVIDSRPEHGDLVIRQETANGQRVYVVSAVPGDEQYLVHSEDAAILQAIAFASSRSVRVWLTDGRRRLTMLANFRIDQSYVVGT
jgi:hypothetical protein